MLKVSGVFAQSMVTLLIVSDQDIASTIQGDALLARGGWLEMSKVEGGCVWKHENKDVWLSSLEGFYLPAKRTEPAQQPDVLTSGK